MVIVLAPLIILPDEILTLERARSVAVRANPNIHAAYARLESARARIVEAQSRYFPTVSFTHSMASAPIKAAPWAKEY